MPLQVCLRNLRRINQEVCEGANVLGLIGKRNPGIDNPDCVRMSETATSVTETTATWRKLSRRHCCLRRNQEVFRKTRKNRRLLRNRAMRRVRDDGGNQTYQGVDGDRCESVVMLSEQTRPSVRSQRSSTTLRSSQIFWQ